MRDEERGTRDEERGTRDEERGTREEGQGTRGKIIFYDSPPGSGGVDAKDSPKVKTEQTGW